MNQRFRGGLRWKHYYLGVKLFFIPAPFFICPSDCTFIRSSPAILPVLLWVIAGKMFSDFLLIARYTFLYKIQYMIRYFLPLSLIHPILALVVALKGNLFSFTWKNRRYTKEHEIRHSISL